MLLQAGAKPISTQLLRESAVILASKLSSPLLPCLLQYVTDCKLLNQMDSDGKDFTFANKNSLNSL